MSKQFGEIIIDNCEYAFDPIFEVSDKNKLLQINISTNKRGKGNFFHRTLLITIFIQLSNNIIFWV